jgi:uncharacterized protein YjiS (DUF1127 family)
MYVFNNFYFGSAAADDRRMLYRFPERRFLARFADALARAIAQSRLRRELAHLDDRMLKDIGVSRMGRRFVRPDEAAKGRPDVPPRG